MKTTVANAIIVSGTSGVVPPRWGLEFVGDTACYKHVAPLALSAGVACQKKWVVFLTNRGEINCFPDERTR